MLDQLTILAPGLLGGSVARAARARGVANRIVIWARRRETRKAIAGQPWCDAVAETPADAAREATLTVIAAPVDTVVPLVRQIAPQLPAGAIVTDVGSVKQTIATEAHAAMPPGAFFVGSHPMAGSEKTGWEHGTAALFEHRSCFVVPLAGTAPEATARVSRFWADLGAAVAVVSPEEHDRIVAHISHLPHVLAACLCSFLGEKDPSWRRYAGRGLGDTTRIASSDPALWRTILEQNRDELRRALGEFQVELRSFDAALAKGDWTGVTERLARGKAFRDEL